MKKNKDWNGNKNSIYKTLGANNHCDHEYEEYGFYATDPVAIDKLLTKEILSNNVWECASGSGCLSNRLKEHGVNVFSTDIVDRGCCDEIVDFLNCDKEFKGDIITNPPYKFAKEFVLKALDILQDGYKCFMFLKIQFLEGKARYKELFSKYPPKKVYVFSERVMCAKNGNFEEMKAGGGSAVAYAWYVWEKGFNGETIISWL